MINVAVKVLIYIRKNMNSHRYSQSSYDITLSQKFLSFHIILLNYVRSVLFYYDYYYFPIKREKFFAQYFGYFV